MAGRLQTVQHRGCFSWRAAAVVNNPERVCDGCPLPASLSPESYIIPFPTAQL